MDFKYSQNYGFGDPNTTLLTLAAAPSDTAYWSLKATTNGWVQIDLGEMKNIYSIVIRARQNYCRYTLLSCYVQLLKDSANSYAVAYRSDNFADPLGSTTPHAWDNINHTPYPGYSSYTMYPPNTTAIGAGPNLAE